MPVLLVLLLLAFVVLVAIALLPLTLIQRYRVGTARRPARSWVVAINLVGTAVSAALQKAVRKHDVVVRWGGEEMLLILPSTTVEQGRALVDRARRKVAALKIDGLPPVTVSAGVAELEPGDLNAETALGRADTRLYEAKKAGRNAVR